MTTEASTSEAPRIEDIPKLLEALARKASNHKNPTIRRGIRQKVAEMQVIYTDIMTWPGMNDNDINLTLP